MANFAKPMGPLTSVQPELPKLSKEQLDFSRSANYVNRTKRYVVAVPALPEGGEPLVYPVGTDEAGKAIKELSDGTPEKGIVFFNGKDRAWQAVRGNGHEAILITDVDAAQAIALDAKKTELLGGAHELSLTEIKDLLRYASQDLGLIDAQNKKASAVATEMIVIDGSVSGHMQVIKDTLHKAIFVPEGFIFTEGPVKQTYPEGAALVTSGRHVWGIDKEVFIRNFKRVNEGQEIDLVSLVAEFPAK